MSRKLCIFCVTILAMVSLSACGTTSHHKSASHSSNTKIVKRHKKTTHRKKNASSSSQNNQQSQSSSQPQQQQNQNSQDNEQDSYDKEMNEPYKGYPSYRAYLEANGGDPDVQRQTDQMQTQWEIQHSYANPDGTPTVKGQEVINEAQNGAFGDIN